MLIMLSQESSAWSWSPTTLGAVLSTVTVLVSLLLLGLTLRQAASQANANIADHKRRSIGDTHRHLEQIVDAISDDVQVVYTVCNSRGFVGKKQAAKYSTCHDEASESWRVRLAITSILNRYNHMASGVHLGLFDIETVSRTSGWLLISLRFRLRHYIEEAQDVRSDAYLDFMKLVDTLEHMQKLDNVANKGSKDARKIPAIVGVAARAKPKRMLTKVGFNGASAKRRPANRTTTGNPRRLLKR